MEQYIIGNIILIFCLAALAGFFSKEGRRAEAAWVTFVFAFVVTFWVWTIYVAAHFITKYW